MDELVICSKQYIDEEDFKKINSLKKTVLEDEEIFLKLELDYKLNLSLNQKQELPDQINEWMCYWGDTLIGYLGLCNFGGADGELTGMVHPLYRRKGIFTKLYQLALKECKKRGFQKILLVCDHKSSSGLSFIQSVGGGYSFSEYEMKQSYTAGVSIGGNDIALIKARNCDVAEIEKQNGLYFGDNGRTIILPEDEEKRNRITYLIWLGSEVIGKIRIDFDFDEGFISGFGILPQYRGKGYGRQTLLAALHIIYEKNSHGAALEVAAENRNALHLYESCGFKVTSVTDYYEDKSFQATIPY